MVVHGRVLCKCEEREVYSRKKKITLFMCPTSQLLFQSPSPSPPPHPSPLPLRRDRQLRSRAVWSSCDWHPPLPPPHQDASHTTWGARVELALKVGHGNCLDKKVYQCSVVFKFLPLSPHKANPEELPHAVGAELLCFLTYFPALVHTC